MRDNLIVGCVRLKPDLPNYGNPTVYRMPKGATRAGNYGFRDLIEVTTIPIARAINVAAMRNVRRLNRRDQCIQGEMASVASITTANPCAIKNKNLVGSAINPNPGMISDCFNTRFKGDGWSICCEFSFQVRVVPSSLATPSTSLPGLELQPRLHELAEAPTQQESNDELLRNHKIITTTAALPQKPENAMRK
jgi:hypothetical protein